MFLFPCGQPGGCFAILRGHSVLSGTPRGRGRVLGGEPRRASASTKSEGTAAPHGARPGARLPARLGAEVGALTCEGRAETRLLHWAREDSMRQGHVWNLFPGFPGECISQAPPAASSPGGGGTGGEKENVKGNPGTRPAGARVCGREGERGGRRGWASSQVPGSSGHKALATEAQVTAPAGWLTSPSSGGSGRPQSPELPLIPATVQLNCDPVLPTPPALPAGP